MKSKQCRIFLAALLSCVLAGDSVRACSWAAFNSGKVSVVGRSMDWYSSDNAVVKGQGRNVAVKAADTANALEYVSKYASIQVHSFTDGLVVDAMNEKGLQGSILFLDNSTLPAPQSDRKDVNPGHFIAYAVASFATVQEVVDSLKTVNFTPAHMGLPGADGNPIPYKPENWPGHYAFADAAGDKAVIEFIKGEITVYHGKQYDAMTNEPWYDIHLTFDAIGYQPNGTISTVDRRTRAKHYLRDMYERGVDTRQRAILAMRGLLASVFAGTEEIDRAENEVYPTVWTAVIDQNSGVYYISRITSWCSEIYDFSMFSPDKPETVALKARPCPYPDVDAENTQ